MKIIYAIWLSLLLMGSSYAADQIAHFGPPPDAGISDDNLVKLGTSADTEMLRRFDETENESLRKGLLFRMRLYGDLKKPGAKMFAALKTYIEHEVSNCKDEVSLLRIFNIGSALNVAGQRGGKLAVEYLEQWVMDESVYGRIQCFNHARTAEDSQDQLRRSALMGLGYTGEKSARDFLSAVGQKPPKVKYIGSFRGVVDTAISEYDQIRKHGIENHFQASRENIKTYHNRKPVPGK